MSKLKYLGPAVALLAGLLVSSTSSHAKPEYVKATKKACNYCHVNATSKDKAEQKKLTKAGEFFKKNNTLDGYKE
jgi:hypothetical protein